MKEFKDRIKHARKAQHLTQTQVAEQVGISQAFLAELETGRKNCSIDVLFKLCDVLGCSSDYLIGRSSSPHYKVMEEAELPDALQKTGITLEVLERLNADSISESEIKLALQLAKVVKNEKNGSVENQ